ncbi:MAG: PstS family phosphate ABC transporter substrate-binding protein [Phototrophicaceae bacterium]
MKNLQRGIRVLALIALFVTGIALLAQESTEEAQPEATEIVTEEMTPEAEATEEVMVEETPEAEATEEVMATDVPSTIEEVAGSSVSVVGSGIVNPAIQALIDGSGSIITYDVTTTGTNAGFEQFCAGTADLVSATRPIDVPETALCSQTGVEFVELLIGFEVTVVISNPEDSFLTCLTPTNLTALFSPSATATQWDEVVSTATDTVVAETTPEAEATEEVAMSPAISVLLPEDSSITYAIFDSVVNGFGFRADAQTMDTASIISTVASTSGAIGVVPLEVALENSDSVSILGIDARGEGCAQPSIETVEFGQYPIATPLYLYVNTSAQETLAFFLDYITSSDSASALNMAGYTGVSDIIYGVNRAIVLGEAPSRALTEAEVTYEIPANLAGNINIVGATSGFAIASGNATRLTSTQQSLTINNNFNGQVAGIEAYCNGDADILFVTDNAEAVCEGTVPSVSYDFGQQVVVLVSNAGDSYASCLTLDQINTIFSASSTATVSQWSNVADAFPEQDLVLVGVSAGNVLTDILMNSVTEGVANPIRADFVETNSDPLYRGAAIGNVSGALTYMSWINYQEVLENGQTNTQVVAVDSGSGCVVPSAETVADGSYTISRNLTMLVKESSLATVPVQSLVWSMFTDGNFTIIESFDFVGGINADDLSQFRSDLLVQFEEATTASLSAPEVTPEVTPEATSEATEE